MQKQFVHMRDQKANLLAMEIRQRQQERELLWEQLVVLLTMWISIIWIALP